MKRRRIDWGWWSLVGLVVAFVLAAGFGSCRKATVDGDCRAAGHRDGLVNWGGLGAAYCVKRVDQTDQVTPLEEAVP